MTPKIIQTYPKIDLYFVQLNKDRLGSQSATGFSYLFVCLIDIIQALCHVLPAFSCGSWSRPSIKYEQNEEAKDSLAVIKTLIRLRDHDTKEDNCFIRRKVK